MPWHRGTRSTFAWRDFEFVQGLPAVPRSHDAVFTGAILVYDASVSLFRWNFRIFFDGGRIAIDLFGRTRQGAGEGRSYASWWTYCAGPTQPRSFPVLACRLSDGGRGRYCGELSVAGQTSVSVLGYASVGRPDCICCSDSGLGNCGWPGSGVIRIGRCWIFGGPANCESTNIHNNSDLRGWCSAPGPQCCGSRGCVFFGWRQPWYTQARCQRAIIEGYWCENGHLADCP